MYLKNKISINIVFSVRCTFCFTLPMTEFPSYENNKPLLLGVCHKATPDDWFMTESENDNCHSTNRYYVTGASSL